MQELVAETLAKRWRPWNDIDLESSPTGKRILEMKPDALAHLLLALIDHASQLDGQLREFWEQQREKVGRVHWHLNERWPARQVSAQTLRRLLRRKLPLEREHLVKLAAWIAAGINKNEQEFPLNAFVKAIETQPAIVASDAELRSLLEQIANDLGQGHSKETPRLGQRLNVVLAQPPASNGPSAAPASATSPVDTNSTAKTEPPQKHNPATFEHFKWEQSDPLASEHATVARLVSETLKSGWKWTDKFDLNSTHTGQKLLKADPNATARLLLALVAHAAHYDGMEKASRELERDDLKRMQWPTGEAFERLDMIMPLRQVSAQTALRLLKRRLPLAREHLVAMADWLAISVWPNPTYYPLSDFVKALEAHSDGKPLDEDLGMRVARVGAAFADSKSKEVERFVQRLRMIVERVTGSAGILPAKFEAKSFAARSHEVAGKMPALPVVTQPAPVGSPNVLVQMKQFLGIFPQDTAATELIGLDRFPLRADSPLRAEHELINIYLPEVVGTVHYHSPDISKTRAGAALLACDRVTQERLLLAATERCANTHFAERQGGFGDPQFWQSQYAVLSVFCTLVEINPELDRNGVFDVLLYLTALFHHQWLGKIEALEEVFQDLDKLAAESPLTPGERHVLHRLRCQCVRTSPFGRPNEQVQRLTRMLQDNLFLALVPGEAWPDALNAELGQMPGAARDKWVRLLQHAATATSARPSDKWLKTAKENLEAVGPENFSAALVRWLPLVNAPRTIRMLGAGMIGRHDRSGLIDDDNALCLRGLLWIAPEVVTPELIRAIGAVTVSCYKKLPGIGPRAVKVGNAGVYALSQINDPLALGQLALLKVKVKFGTAQKEIEKAFTLAAERSGLPREELEEMSVPTYGLTDVGLCEEKLGEFTARLSVTGTDSTELLWVKPDGKTQGTVPAPVKKEHAEDLKELQAAAKDIQKMLPAQRDRIDSLFLQQRTWPFDVWRERYLDHPLVGTLARRILWQLTNAGRTSTGIWFNGRLVDLDLKPIELKSATTVQLWHPIGKPTAEISAWRAWLDEQGVQQPFKQAHREIYLLTDAERRTRTYSNRYAAHIIKQHQFNALCALRGWKNQLRLMVDADYGPPSLNLPQSSIRAEFWVEGLGTDYGADTNESGVYLRLSTDQVRFYSIEDPQRYAHAHGGGYRPGYQARDVEPLPLEEVPALVFSEVMRDVDLFVGVGSVGNDPTWADGGPEGRYREYWQQFSFGELNASAKTREDVLKRLVPKLKIANRCSFVGKFLVVKGSLRIYKIHLGSGNILMEPNDQYLCIVPNQAGPGGDSVLLPFEGDRTLSIILSKAFLLANDTKIKDQSIVRQIQG